MEENNKFSLERIYPLIEDLKNEFEKMAYPNPYHIWMYNNNKRKNNSNDKSKTNKSKVKSFRFYRYYMYPIVGSLVLLIFAFFAGYYWLNKVDYTYTFFAVLLSGIFFPILVFINTQSYYVGSLKSWRVLVLFCIAAGFMALGISNHNSVAKEILLIACLFSPVISYLFVFFPLSKRVFNVRITEKLVELQKELENLSAEKQKIFRNEIIGSHNKILDRINNLEMKFQKPEGNCNELYKLLKLSVLEALKIELVQSSSRSLELTRNWQFIKLTQIMLDKIMKKDDEKKHITLVGDLSFLSHKKGLEDLCDTVIQKGKTFVVYFSGKSISGNEDIVESEYFNKLVPTLDSVVSTHYSTNDEKIKLWNNLTMELMPSVCFTGLGFIGLKDKKTDSDYKEVYSFISSSLLPDEESKNIEEANPFVFSWNDKTHYFREYIMGIKERNKNASPKLKIMYKGKSYENPMSVLKDYLYTPESFRTRTVNSKQNAQQKNGLRYNRNRKRKRRN